MVKLPIFDKLLSDSRLSAIMPGGNVTLWTIQGQPGIGKSLAAIFIMKRAMLMNIPFMFSSGDTTSLESALVYCWEDGIPTVCSISDAPIDEKNCLWIMNQKEHRDFQLLVVRLF